MPEKDVPNFDLAEIKAEFSEPSKLVATRTALEGAAEVGHESEEIVEIIQTIEAAHFYKSMTSNYNVNVWQDVYHIPYSAGTLYVKFTDNGGPKFLLLSYKEK